MGSDLSDLDAGAAVLVNQRRACIALYGNETLDDSSKPMPWMQQLRGEIDQIM